MLVLALIAHVAEGRSMRVSPRVEVSVSFMPLALAAVLFGPAAAAIVGAAAMLHRPAEPACGLVAGRLFRLYLGVAHVSDLVEEENLGGQGRRLDAGRSSARRRRP